MITLTKKELENIKNYKYATSSATPLDKVFDPWWEFVVNRLPQSVAPNLITISGIVVPLTGFIYLTLHDTRMDAVLPASVLLLNAFSIFWYQTLDAIDGKQARRTDNCSPLGQLLDHNLDQFSHVFFSIMGLALIRCSGRIAPILMIMNGQLFPHFSIEYRKHFTGFHATVVETLGGIQIGATECCVIMYSLQLIFAFCPATNQITTSVYNTKGDFGLPFEVEVVLGDVLAFSTFVLSIQYNVGNFYFGLTNAEDKVYAALCILPYFYVSGMVVLASLYSQFWAEHSIFFLLGVGMLITNVTGNFNLKSSARMRLNPIYLDPFVFGVVLYSDYHRLADPMKLKLAYALILLNRTVQYLLFLRGMITQICDYMDLPFIQVKQGYRSCKKQQ